jgi:hypothetical protein
VSAGHRVETWARPQGQDVAPRLSAAARPVICARPSDEKRLIVETVTAGLGALITIVLAVAALSWLSPRPVEPTAAVRPAPAPSSACCDVVP